MSNNNYPRIRLTRTIDETKIEVCISKENEFPEAILLLNRLCHRYSVEQTKILANKLWKREDKSITLNVDISNKGHRIALSLLDGYPQGKQNTTIQSECKLTKDEVYKYLNGKTGNMGSWFIKEKDEWILTQYGEENVMKIATLLLSSDNRETST